MATCLPPIDISGCWWSPPHAVRNGVVAGGVAGGAAALLSKHRVAWGVGAGVGVGLLAWYFFSGKWWR